MQLKVLYICSDIKNKYLYHLKTEHEKNEIYLAVKYEQIEVLKWLLSIGCTANDAVAGVAFDEIDNGIKIILQYPDLRAFLRLFVLPLQSTMYQ